VGGYIRSHAHICPGRSEPEFSQIARIVLAANTAARQQAKPGLPAGHLDRAAGKSSRSWLWEFFTHRTGHGLGLEAHEEPYIRGITPFAGRWYDLYHRTRHLPAGAAACALKITWSSPRVVQKPCLIFLATGSARITHPRSQALVTSRFAYGERPSFPGDFHVHLGLGRGHVPLLPAHLSQGTRGGSIRIGAILGGFGLMMVVSHIPAGYLADRVGRKPVLVSAWLIV